MPLLRLLLVGLVAALLGVPATTAAQAPFGIGTITDNLGATGVAVDPDAKIPAAQVRRFEQAVARLRADEIPADVVVLDQQALGAATFAEELHRARGYDGIQVVIVRRPNGISFSAPGVYDFQQEHQDLVEQAALTLASDPVEAAAVLARRGWALALAEAADNRSEYDDSGGTDAFEVTARVVGIILTLAVVFVIVWRRRLRKRAAAGMGSSWSFGVSRVRSPPQQTHEALDSLLDDLAKRITELAPEVDRPDAPEAARRAYAEAVLAYGEARDALPGATTTRRARSVHNDIDRGLRAAEVAQAIVDGDHPGDNGRRTRGR